MHMCGKPEQPLHCTTGLDAGDRMVFQVSHPLFGKKALARIAQAPLSRDASVEVVEVATLCPSSGGAAQTA